METQQRPARPTDPEGSRRPRRAVWIVGGLVLLLGAGAFLLPREDGPGPPEAQGARQSPDLGPRQPTFSEAIDPAEQRRLADLEERRGRYGSLRTSFGAGVPASPRALARLSPALGALWPPGGLAWTAACVGELCRVDAPGPAAAWQEQLAADPAIRKLSERVVVDPDGAATAAYLVLVAAGAPPGAAVLDEVEEEFRRSTEIRECLARTGATGGVTYTLTVDTSGYSYLQQADLPSEALDCADRVLAEILDRHPPPKTVQTASRTLALRR